jgi:PAS domain S-box-containing protein
MLVTFRHLLLCSIAAGLAVLVTLTVWALLRDGGDLEQAWQQLDLVFLASLLTAAVVVVLGGWLIWRVRRPLGALQKQLAAVRLSPSRASLNSGPLTEAQMASLGTLFDEVDALCGSYRKALADRVKQREALDDMRSRLEDQEGGNPRLASQRLPGASRNMVARLTPNLRWLNATPALLRLLGLPMSAINGRAFLEQVSNKDSDDVAARLAEALRGGEVHNVPLRLHIRRRRPAPDNVGPPRQVNEHRYMQMDVLTRYNDNGQPLHLRCYFEDVTERIRAERDLHRRTEELSQTNEQLLRINQDLERLKESYRDLYHNAPIMFFSLDAAGRFVACNDTMTQNLGYRREDLLEKSYTTLLTAEGAAAWDRQANTAAGRPHALMTDGEVEMQWAKRDGTVIDVWIRSIPLTDENDEFVRSRSAAQDVTHRNRLANELRRRGDELEQANAELRAINKELDDFTAVVSHDLKEPLRTLEAYSTLLAEDFSTQLGADGFECINHMLMASRRLGKLIDDLLTLSRAGRIATTPRVFHLNEAVAVVRRDLGDMILRKGATVTVEGSLPTIVGDLERVTQLLSNLVANGLKYNTHPQPLVTLTEAPQTVQAGFVTLCVRDNGIGIDPKYHQEIFGVFRRLHRKEEFEGTGAGLAICKKIVQAHGGRIWVESVPGQGSAFHFTLPRSPGSAAALLPPSVPGRDAAEKNGALGIPVSANLLLIEDMAEMGLIVQRLARKAGHNLKWLTTAEAAWEYLQENRPDLLLLDIHLPGMDGIELCQRLRALPRQAGLPIALFSQGAYPEDISAGLAAGANYVLSKELLCQPDTWRQRLQEILVSCQQGASSGAVK